MAQFAGNLRGEERVGLAAALVLHAALVAMLLVSARDKPVPMPERMVVSLAEDVGLESTSPNPASEGQAAIAPTLSDQPAPETVPEPPALAPTPPRPAPPPPPARAEPPRPTPPPPAARTPAPARPAPPKPTPSRPSPPARAEAPAPNPPAPTRRPTGGSRIGDDFLAGTASGSRSDSAAMPASAIGSAERASLAQAIARQLKPHWAAPQGVDAELLVSVLSFDLNPDGSLAGPPRLVGQEGITQANRPQAGRHAEQAIRAVQLAAPFDLPPQFYNAWKNIRSVRFDRNLSR